ncbi:putative 4-hydroxyacetophenone monooxygenase [Diaporthe ampelina]|uniref:Putative 4-hydroxyacetophenone monooxygenase n=1 Tax=Diaporthe ampelina TaxID=1214573 RepID=A0A0G2I698_9PEZI|nr:putative 4-hydroxyacetophenone monooxygenase [Diaporthe ampelina]
MAPIATADGTPSHTTNPVLGNSADEVDVPLKLAVAEPEHGSSKLAPPPDGEAKHLEYPRSRVNLVNRFVDEPRKIKVIVIGGGLAGILAGCLLPQKVPGVELVIYEKNPDFSTFSPKTDWSDEFAPGAEIRDYWQSVAKKYNVYQYARFQHQVEDASWDAAAGLWTLKITDLASGSVKQDKADFVLTCIGRFNAWKLPNYTGLSDYSGILRHASNWDPDFDPTGKRVAVIGNGASGIQLVANLQRKVSRLDHYARSKTWIAASWAGDERTLEPQPIPDEKKKALEDPQSYLAFRKELEDKYWRKFATFLKGEANDNARQFFTETMKARLSKKPELFEQLVPDFGPNCRRLTPGPGYLEALQEANVDFIRQPIKRFTKTGIETADGTQRDVDAIFCATGANGDMVPPFSIRASGRDLSSLWRPDGEYGFPYTYLGAATPGFPNLFFVHGPQYVINEPDPLEAFKTTVIDF